MFEFIAKWYGVKYRGIIHAQDKSAAIEHIRGLLAKHHGPLVITVRDLRQ